MEPRGPYHTRSKSGGCLIHPLRALAQVASTPTPVQGIDASVRASELVAARDTRPEARSFAQGMLELRRALAPKLEGLARERGLTLPTVLEFEHQAIIENLEPLDSLELSRRCAEVEVQALEQELGIYRAVPASDEAIRVLANDTVPKLEERLDEAQRARQSLGP